MTAAAFGDLEPEDSWDADDPTDELTANLRRRVILLYLGRGVLGPLDTLERIALAVVVARARDDLEPRDLTRIADLFDDIAYVARRLEAEAADGG